MDDQLPFHVSDKEFHKYCNDGYSKCLDRLLDTYSHTWTLFCTLTTILLVGFSILITIKDNSNVVSIFMIVSMIAFSVMIFVLVIKNFDARAKIHSWEMLFYETIKIDVLKCDTAKDSCENKTKNEMTRINIRKNEIYWILFGQVIIISIRAFYSGW